MKFTIAESQLFKFLGILNVKPVGPLPWKKTQKKTKKKRQIDV